MCSTAAARSGTRLHVTGRVADGPDVQRRAPRPPAPAPCRERCRPPPRTTRDRGRAPAPRPAPCPAPACGRRWLGRTTRRAVGVVGAEQPQVDVRARVGQLLDHVLVHPVNVLDAEVPARDAGLVGHHRDRDARPVERGDRLDGTVEELDTLDRPDVAGVDDDRAVTVEQDACSAPLMCACALHRPAPPERLIARPPVAALARQPARRYSGSMSGEPVHTEIGVAASRRRPVAGLVGALLVATRSGEPSRPSPRRSGRRGRGDLAPAPDAPRKPPARICGSAGLKGPSTPPAGARVIRTSTNLSNAVLNAPPGKTFWLEPGVHHAGDDEFAQLIPKDGQSFIGAPGAVLDGQRINRYAFTQQATDVTIAYLTIRNFTSPGQEGS